MARDTCYYDGLCGMCRRSVRVLSAMDWLGRLDFTDVTRVDPAELPVPIDAALGGMPMRTAGGAVLVGFPAVRRALRQTPLGVLPALLLYLPGVSALGRAVYDRIAASRRRECTVDPTRGSGV